MRRVVKPELLDTLPPEDPLAIGSRRDLRRVNWWMGNARIMRRVLRAQRAGLPAGKLLELGAGDGHFMLSVAKGFSPSWPNPECVLLDRQPSDFTEVLAAFNHLGWRAEIMLADVFSCPPIPDPVAAVVANLFLHHFEDDALSRLLGQVARQTNLFVAVEPWRFAQPWVCGQLLRLIGCNAVTLHDAVVSVRAGFQSGEISALWPEKSGWELTERRAGFFSHLFIARRIL